MTTPAEWYYSRGAASLGPVRFEELLKLVAIGQLGPVDLVWTAGMAGWLPASSVPALYPPGTYGSAGYNNPPTNTLAIWSLVAGVAAWVGIPLIPALLAVILGHMARSQIRHSNGAETGDGLARAGLVLGYVNLILFVLAIGFFFSLLAIGLMSQNSM
jgi:hypothetical protein